MHTARTILTLAALAASLIATGCRDDRAPAAATTRAPVDVSVTQVVAAGLPILLEATGSIEPRVSVSPGTKIMGRVERVPVETGDRVERGDLLAALEQRDLEAAVAQAEAAVAVAEATLDNARSQQRRMTDLHARRSVTDKNLEDATSGLRIAEGQLAQAHAALQSAEVALGYARIVSPIGGRVTAKRVEAGDMATPGAPLFTVEDTSTVKVAVALPESDVVGLAAGAAARVRVDVVEREFAAVVDRVLPTGDPASRTFRVELVLDNADGTLRSGMFARTAFERGIRTAVTVPRSAVVERGQLRGLFVVDERSIAVLRWVRLGRAQGAVVEVISGLTEGERIVTAPPAGFADGTPVAAR